MVIPLLSEGTDCIVAARHLNLCAFSRNFHSGAHGHISTVRSLTARPTVITIVELAESPGAADAK